MTYQEFLDKLRETPRRWTLERRKQIALPKLHGLVSHCPLSAVADTSACNTHKAAAVLGIDLDMAKKIARAADGERGYSRNVRRDLLAACGLIP